MTELTQMPHTRYKGPVEIASDVAQPPTRSTTKLVGRKVIVPGRIQGKLTEIAWDTGAEVSIAREPWLKKHLPPNSYEIRPVEELEERGIFLVGAGDSTIDYIGYTELDIQFGRDEGTQTIRVPFMVSPKKSKMPLLGSNGMEVFLEGDSWEAKMRRLVSFGVREKDVILLMGILNQLTQDAMVSSVTVQEDAVVEAQSSKMICCQVQVSKNQGTESVSVNQVGQSQMNSTICAQKKPTMFEPNNKWEQNNPHMRLYETLVDENNGIITVKVRNTSEENFYFEGGEQIGTLEEVEIVEGSQIEYTDLANVSDAKLVEVNKIVAGEDITRTKFAPGQGQKESKGPAVTTDWPCNTWMNKKSTSIGSERDSHIDLSVKTKDTAPVDANVKQVSCPQTQHEDISEGNSSSQTSVNQNTVPTRTDNRYHDTQ